jgi:hypothetical protein
MEEMHLNLALWDGQDRERLYVVYMCLLTFHNKNSVEEGMWWEASNPSSGHTVLAVCHSSGPPSLQRALA